MSSKTTPKSGYGGPSIGIGLGVVLLFFWVVTGTVGFRFIEGWSYIDSLYMTIITISTVGFQEVHELSEGGRLFASFVIIAGLGTAVYTFTRLGQVLLEGELIAVFGRRRMKQNLDRLKDHIIVCGCGRIGQPVVDNLRGEDVQFCVIDRDESLVGHFQEQNVLFLVGDATEEETLRAAGVERARSLLALLPSDAENLYLTITAKSINPSVAVIARATDEKAGAKIELGGADRVISPYGVASLRVLHAAMRPAVVDLLDLMSQPDSLGLMLEEFRVGEVSPLVGRTLGESDVRGRYGVTVVAVKHDAYTAVLHPEPSEKVDIGDTIVAMGTDVDLRKLQSACEKDTS